MRLLIAILAAQFTWLGTAAFAEEVCTQVYEPVCAFTTDGKPDTFPNECVATKQRGARLLHDGKCVSTGEHCPELEQHVCVIDTKTSAQITFKNLCFAENAGFTLVHDGDCK